MFSQHFAMSQLTSMKGDAVSDAVAALIVVHHAEHSAPRPVPDAKKLWEALSCSHALVCVALQRPQTRKAEVKRPIDGPALRHD